MRKAVPEVIEEIERPVEPTDAARYGAGMDGGPDAK
jgi:hypothetical protein